jgi:hypothetical protein
MWALFAWRAMAAGVHSIVGAARRRAAGRHASAFFAVGT